MRQSKMEVAVGEYGSVGVDNRVWHVVDRRRLSLSPKSYAVLECGGCERRFHWVITPLGYSQFHLGRSSEKASYP